MDTGATAITANGLMSYDHQPVRRARTLDGEMPERIVKSSAGGGDSSIDGIADVSKQRERKRGAPVERVEGSLINNPKELASRAGKASAAKRKRISE